MRTGRKRKMLVIGWDAADWKVIMPLIRAGRMPALQKLMENGVWGNIATLDPPLSPMLWTSIATGKRADQHGILGFIEPRPDGKGLRPVSTTSRKVKAIWNILNQEGYKSNVVSWWPSNPAEPINGVMVSNFYQQERGKVDEPWPMLAGTVYPKRLEETLKDLRVHPNELTAAHVLPFIPKATSIDQENDKRVYACAKFIAHSSTVHNAATHLMQNEPWDFMAVYHDAIDHFCHGFMKFHPPQLPGIPDEMFENYKQVVTGAYLWHDMMLERMMELVDEDTTIMLVSDHGFHSDHLRPLSLPKEPAAPAYEHRPLGTVVISGPGIKKGERIHGASVLDVTPTILSLFDLPVGEDMVGKPLVQVLEEPKLPTMIPSWEDVAGESGMHPSEMQEDPWEAREALQQLVDLGYVEKPGEDVGESVRKAQNESQYYLARNHVHAHEHDIAVPILEKLFEDAPEEIRYGMTLAQNLLHLKEYQRCRDVVDKLRVQMEGDSAFLDYVEGSLFLASNRPRKAQEFLFRSLDRAPNSVETHLMVGRSFSARHMWEDAEEAYLKALAIDEENASAHHGLALTYLRRDQYEQAVDELLNAVELRYFYPNAHYHLGEALYKLGHYANSADAFKVSVTMVPGNAKAHRWLVRLYQEHLLQPEKAAEHVEFLNKNIKGVITIVSGLPRSGTSMLMQMLEAGGLEILTDKKREADNNNPKGYYEFEQVKSIMRDNSWLDQAEGKVLKVVAPLLPHLSGQYDYKIIFMQREMSEVLRSQQVMLGKTGAQADAYPMALANAFKKQLEQAEAWIERSPNVEVLFVDHAQAIKNPEEAAENINVFLGNSLEIDGMTKVVDPDLYRNRLAKS